MYRKACTVLLNYDNITMQHLDVYIKRNITELLTMCLCYFNLASSCEVY